MIAVTHPPSISLHACERTFVPDSPLNHDLARAQHLAYCQTVRQCGADLIALNISLDLPDATFIEDTAVVLDEVAVLCSMGAASRRAEPGRVEPFLREYRPVERIELPATIDGGDVLRVGRRLLVGQSQRTSAAGLAALAAIAGRHCYEVISVAVNGCLHLKTACTALPDGRLIANPDWIDTAALADYEIVPVPVGEPFGANVAVLNSRVLVSAACPRTAEQIARLGFNVLPLDISEFAKAEGGVTCLSLLIP